MFKVLSTKERMETDNVCVTERHAEIMSGHICNVCLQVQHF